MDPILRRSWARRMRFSNEQHNRRLTEDATLGFARIRQTRADHPGH